MGSEAAEMMAVVVATSRVRRSDSASPNESKSGGISTTKFVKPVMNVKVDDTRARPVELTWNAPTSLPA